MQNEMKIITLSPERWAESKVLRVEALKDSPTAFGMSLEEELVRDDSNWIERLEEAEKGEYRWLVYLEKDGALVGVAGASREKHIKGKHTACIVGVYITPTSRGGGWAKKLMETLIEKIQENKEINRLELQVTSTQESAVHLYESLGFVQVGVLHKEMFVDGVYYDQIIMEKFLYE